MSCRLDRLWRLNRFDLRVFPWTVFLIGFWWHFRSQNPFKIVPKSIQNQWKFASERRQIFAWVFSPLWTAFLHRKWYQNHLKCRSGRIVKTAFSCGMYCKNQGLGPSHSMTNLFQKSCGKMLYFWLFLGAVWHLFGHPKTIQNVLKIVSKN